MNITGKKYLIHDYSKELENKLNNNKENVFTKKILVGKVANKTPIEISDNKNISLKSNKNIQVNNGKIHERNSSFGMLLNSLLTPAANNNSCNSSLINSPNHTPIEILEDKNGSLKQSSNENMNSVEGKDKRSHSFEKLLESLLTPRINDSTSNSLLPNSSNHSNNLESRESEDQELNFEEVMSQMLTPSFANKMCPKYENSSYSQKQFCDTSTQTSLDHRSEVGSNVYSNDNDRFSHAMEEIEGQTNNNSKEIKHDEVISQEAVLPYFYPHHNSHIEESCSNIAPRSTLQSHVHFSVETKILTRQSCNNSVNTNESLINILDVLSQDITVVASKVELNSIDKIGTKNWLQYALRIAGKTTKKRKKSDVVEIQNDCNLIDENSSNQIIKRFCHGSNKIVKIQESEKIQENQFSDIFDAEETNLSQATEMQQQLKLAIDKISQDKDLLCSDTSIAIIEKNKIKMAIHDIFLKLYDSFQNNKVPCLVVRQNSVKSCIFEDGRLKLKPFHEASKSRINLPGLLSRLKFCRMLYILAKTYTLLKSDTVITKREIFYQIKHLLKSQRQINDAIECVTQLLNVGQWHLNIVAHSGLVYGKLKLKWLSGAITDCSESVTIIPLNVEEITEIQSTASFILVVEKEAVFQKLLDENLPNKLGRSLILVTGKGSPDYSAQLFLKKISTLLALPVFILTDPDVYGIKIMFNYRFGSIKSCHLTDYLVVPNARWLGVFPSEISKFGMQDIRLTERDKSLLKNMMKYPFLSSHPKILDELNCLTRNNKKASIEGLIKNNTFLSESYLPTKLFNEDFI